MQQPGSTPAPVPAASGKRRRRRRRSPLAALGGWLLVLGSLGALVALGLALGLLLFGEYGYDGRIYPRVSVRGHDISYLDVNGARTAITGQHADYLRQPIQITYGERTWQPSAAELGLRLEVDRSVYEAVSLGRMPTRIESVRTVAAMWEQGVELPLRATIDEQALQAYLLTVAHEVEAPPRNAALRLDGPDVLVSPEQWGVQVLVDETLRDITAALQQFDSQPVALRTRTIAPLVRDSDIAPLADDVRRLFDGPIVLTSDAPVCEGSCFWELKPDQIAEWVHLKQTFSPAGRPETSLHIDQSAVQRALMPIASALHVDGRLPRVDWNGGNLQIIEPGSPGSGLDSTLTQMQINSALRGGTRRIKLPMTRIPPPVIETSLDSLGITAEVGRGVSSFRASQQYRITNIVAGARRMHGILIPPGATFSFNNNLGAVDASNGFVQGAAIVQNRTQQEWGGGLCQVSTTMFRAAFWSGMPIAERHEHTFRIGWYEELGEPPGLDAAIFTGVADLQFVNDTGGWLLTGTSVDLNRQQLTIVLYGLPSQRDVQMSHRVLSRTPPIRQPLYIDDPSRPRGTFKQTDWARPGMTVQVYRTVHEAGEVRRQDTFHTIFEPWPNIYVRGTGRW